jgi:hypothetical protein
LLETGLKIPNSQSETVHFRGCSAHFPPAVLGKP